MPPSVTQALQRHDMNETDHVPFNKFDEGKHLTHAADVRRRVPMRRTDAAFAPVIVDTKKSVDGPPKRCNNPDSRSTYFYIYVNHSTDT